MGPHKGCEPADTLYGQLNLTFGDPVVELRRLYRKYVPIIYLKSQQLIQEMLLPVHTCISLGLKWRGLQSILDIFALRKAV